MKRNKGFTLLEVMITVAILSIVMAAFMTFFGNEIRVYFSKDNEIELKQDARIALDRITTKIRSNNGLSFRDGPSSGIIYKNDVIPLIDTTKDPNLRISTAEINFDYNETLGYGEIKDGSGNKIVGNIKDFKLEKDPELGDKLIKITISCINDKTSEAKEYSTSVRMYSYSG